MARGTAALAAALLAAAVRAQQPYSILDFGAVAGVDSDAQALRNGAAFAAALAAANASSAVGASRAVLVPQGVFAWLPPVAQFSNVVNVTFYLEGTLNASTANFSTVWPGYAENNCWHMLSFESGVGLRFISETGKGLVNGRGNAWWWATIFFGAPRPNLFLCESCTDFELTGISFLNAPQYNVALWGVTRALVQGVTVLVDIEDQLEAYAYVGALEGDSAGAAARAPQRERVGRIMRAAGKVGPTSDAQLLEARAAASRSPAQLQATRRALLPAHLSAQPWFDEAWRVTPPFPMIYALNTDGIDFTGQHVHVRNCSITNFDDTVCPKPQAPPCTRDVLAEDVSITYGVGISMGSVPPDVGGNCIDGVVVRRAVFHDALKTIYVKPNPEKFGQNATGLIANITYEDIVSHDPIWWPIWIGPQQQQQPGSSGTGCSFIYPLDNTTCITDPQVTVRDVTLRRVDFYNGNSPGIIRFNVSNPATGLVFEDVVHHNSSAWPVGADYLCDYASGVALGTTSPVPPCFTKGVE